MRHDGAEIFVGALSIAIIGFLFGLLAGVITSDEPRPATIGGERVVLLDCEEDEVIGYDPRIEFGPRPLSCIHYDVLSEGS